MGKIKYDFYKNPDNKADKLKSKYHIRICDRQTIGTKGIVDNIHMKSTLTSVDINAVIIAFQDEIANQLGQGKIVRLEGLCSFDISLKAKSGICTGEESGKEIELKSVNINPEKEFMERVQMCINEMGMEKVKGKHSVAIPDEKVDSLLNEYFKKEKTVTRPKLQELCSMTRYMAMQQIKRLTDSGKLINIGFKNHPLYVPAPGCCGTEE